MNYFDYYPVNSGKRLESERWPPPANREPLHRKSLFFSKSPNFTLLLPYFHPTFTLPPNRHHRFRPQTRRLRPIRSCVAELGPAEFSTSNQRRAARFFKNTNFHPGFTPDSPRIYPASRAEVGQFVTSAIAATHSRIMKNTDQAVG